MELSIIHAIQSIASPFWDVFFEGITILAEQYLMILIFCALYWLKDKDNGKIMALSLALSLSSNNILKNLINAPRPIGEPGVRSLRVETATGSSFPSGHTQSASTAYWTASGFFSRNWIRIVAAVIIVLIAMSRVYLGVHWPRDVLAGMALGIGSSYAAILLLKKCKKHDMLFAIVSIIVIVFAFIIPSEDLITAAGLVFSMTPAFYIEKKYINFSTDVPKSSKIKRFILGIVVIALIYFLPKLIFPDMYIFRFIRYALVGFGVINICPALFVKLKI